jgi:hypothetical protein
MKHPFQHTIKSYKSLVILIFIVLLGCQSSNILNLNKGVQESVGLGSIGNSNINAWQYDFKRTALANFKEPIKVEASVRHFTKPDYNLYLKAKAHQSSTVNIIYEDSLQIKPKYISFKIIDNPSVIDALNASYNLSVKEYLSNQKQSDMISSISVALNNEQLKQVLSADEVFLVSNGLKSYTLQLYKDKEAKQLLKFNEMVVFDYETSCLCWQEDNRRQLQIVDLVNGTNCPKNTYKSAQQSKKEMDFSKF